MILSTSRITKDEVEAFLAEQELICAENTDEGFIKRKRLIRKGNNFIVTSLLLDGSTFSDRGKVIYEGDDLSLAIFEYNFHC